MPEPKAGETQKEFVARCIPALIDEGKEQDEAVAVCNSMWEKAQEGKAIHICDSCLKALSYQPEEFTVAKLPLPCAICGETPEGGTGLVCIKAREGKAADLSVKALNETESAWIVGGYGMLWGDEARRDLSPWPNPDGSKGEFFTPGTKGLDDIPIKVMTIEHDKDTDEHGAPIKEIVGQTVLERDDLKGRWIEARIEKHRAYARYVMGLIDKGIAYLSSETALHWKEVAANGAIKRWRTAGYTFTTAPMEPRIGPIGELRAAYKAAGLDYPLEDDETGGEDAGASCPDADEAAAKAIALLARINELTTED